MTETAYADTLDVAYAHTRKGVEDGFYHRTHDCREAPDYLSEHDKVTRRGIERYTAMLPCPVCYQTPVRGKIP